MNNILLRFVICLIPVLCSYFFSWGLDKKSSMMLGIFISIILGFILKPAPTGQVALIGLVFAVFSSTIDPCTAFSGFGMPTTWLVVSVFFIAQGVIKTGLSDRIAYIFMKIFGKNILGLTYSIVVTDFFISPFIPTAGAKTGGIVVPVIDSITSNSIENSTETNEKLSVIREFLLILYSQVTAINSAIFLFASSSTIIVYQIATSIGIDISWTKWFKASVVPGILSLLVIPFIVLWSYKRKIDLNVSFHNSAIDKLAKMGKMTFKEWYVLFVLCILLFLWMNNDIYKLNTSTTALLGVVCMLIGNIITYKDIISNTNAWNTLLWFGIILMFSQNLHSLDIMKSFSSSIAYALGGFRWQISFLILCLSYFYCHYFFAGGATQVTSLYSLFLLIAISFGTPKMLSALILGFLSNLYTSLSHYGSISSAILYEKSTMSAGKWCVYSFIFSTMTFIIWCTFGSVWWYFIGLLD